MKYIIDTDPGIDDAIAIMLGVRNNLDIVGFTLATGNVESKKSEKNLKVIQDFLGTDIKMYRGSVENDANPEKAEYAHGKDGLGYAVFPENKRKFEKMKAEDFIIKASKKYKDDLTLVCFGPLTNLAVAIKKDKNLANRLKHVIIMGATYNIKNERPYYEFNVNVDPISAKIVFETPFVDMKIVTHEIGVRSFVEKDYVQNLKNSDDLISRFVGLISDKYMEFSYEHYGTVGLGTPDPTTMADVIEPGIIKYIPCSIEISIDEQNKALCNILPNNESNILVSTDFDLEKFRELFKRTFK